MPSRKMWPSMTIRLGTTMIPIACAWLWRMSDALSVTIRTRAGGWRCEVSGEEGDGGYPFIGGAPFLPYAPGHREPVFSHDRRVDHTNNMAGIIYHACQRI